MNDQPTEFTAAAQAMMPTPEEAQEQYLPTVYPTTQDAYQALHAANVEAKLASNQVIGTKFSEGRSLIAYAILPKLKRQSTHQGDRNVPGAPRLHVLHATKGWRVVHGVAATAITGVPVNAA